MKLIRKISVENLRSIRTQSIDNAGSLNSFVGRNSSGKSNALRSLNLFFNGEIEPGKPIDFSRDHYEERPRLKEKKHIKVSVDFVLPSNFRFRQELEQVEKVGKEFTISREWILDPFRKPQEAINLLVDGKPVPNGPEIARKFLPTISYRYIPNRTIPSAILKNESQAIANSIFARMKGGKAGAPLMKALTEAAERMLENAAKTLKSAGSPLIDPSVSTPENIAEMLTMAGFQAKGAHGLTVQDEEWGAGHQSFFLYQVLYELDTNYGQFFGWKQATVWGVEEPESALHRDLETQLAEQFRNWCFDEDAKLQVFTTTHSPVFSMASDSGYWVELKGTRTEFKEMPIAELAHAADTRGVSGWVHPILYFPWNPVILVEGAIDQTVLTHVCELSGLTHLRFITVPGLDRDEDSGGKDKIVSFLRRSNGLLKNRSKNFPLLVLFDWDVSPELLKNARAAYGENGDKNVQAMNAGSANSLLGTDFRGIERFYPPDVIKASHDASEIVLGISSAPKTPYSISSEQLRSGKGRLLKRILAIHSAERLKELVNIVADVERRLKNAFPIQIVMSFDPPTPPVSTAPLAKRGDVGYPNV